MSHLIDIKTFNKDSKKNLNVNKVKKFYNFKHFFIFTCFLFTIGYFTYLNSIKLAKLENEGNETNNPQFIKHHYYNHSGIKSIIEEVISKNKYNINNTHKDFIVKQVQKELAKKNNIPNSVHFSYLKMNIKKYIKNVCFIKKESMVQMLKKIP